MLLDRLRFAPSSKNQWFSAENLGVRGCVKIHTYINRVGVLEASTYEMLVFRPWSNW